MNTTLAVPKLKTLAKDIKVNKTQAIMAAEEQYKRRVRKEISALNYTARFGVFKKEMKEDLKILKDKIAADIASKIGLFRKFIKIHYDVDSADEYDEIEEIVWEANFMDIELYESIYFSKGAPSWFSKGTVTVFKRVAARLKDNGVLYRQHNQLQDKISFEAMVQVRKALRERLKSSQQLSDMEVVNAVLSQESHCKDIDAVLDSLMEP